MRSNRVRPTFTEKARRDQIIAAAIELIAAEGYLNASIARIAGRAGVAKSAVLYYFSGKDDLVTAIVEHVFARGAAMIIPAVAVETTASGKLTAYIRANCAFLDTHRAAAVAMYEILTGFRTHDGLRLDQAAARSVAEAPPPEEWAGLDPVGILDLGARAGEFEIASPQVVADILRAALDGAAAQIARDLSYDVTGYGEQLVALIDRATRRQP